MEAADYLQLFVEETSLYNRIVLGWLLPSRLWEPLPHFFQTWLRNYLAGTLLYFVSGFLWCFYIYYLKRNVYLPKGNTRIRLCQRFLIFFFGRFGIWSPLWWSFEFDVIGVFGLILSLNRRVFDDCLRLFSIFRFPIFVADLGTFLFNVWDLIILLLLSFFSFTLTWLSSRLFDLFWNCMFVMRGFDLQSESVLLNLFMSVSRVFGLIWFLTQFDVGFAVNSIWIRFQ